jgi:hypothetical protein
VPHPLLSVQLFVQAQQLNRDIFETIYYHALKDSSEIAAGEGTYETYQGSPVSMVCTTYLSFKLKHFSNGPVSVSFDCFFCFLPFFSLHRVQLKLFGQLVVCRANTCEYVLLLVNN